MRAGDELLQDDLILGVTGPDDGQASLDVMARMVYQCAKESKTIGEVMETCGLDRKLTHRIIGQLMVARLVTVLASKSQLRGPGPTVRETPAKEKRGSTPPRLTPEFLEDLDRRYAATKKDNYYDLLDIDPDTPRAELRTRYFALSKKYHPDKVFGEVPKDIKHKMSAVFQKLTNAYDTLSNPKKREAYNETISGDLEIRMIEKRLKQAVSASRPPRSPVTNGSTSDTPPSSAPPAQGQKRDSRGTGSPVSGAPRSAGVSGGARSSFVNPLKKQSSVPAKEPPPSEPPKRQPFVPSMPPSPAIEARRRQLRRNLAGRALADLISRATDNPDSPYNVDKHLEEAEQALAQGRLQSVLPAIKKVMELDPENERAQEILAQAKAANARIQAEQHIRRGRFSKKEGHPDEAKWHFEQALVLEKDSLDARHLLAELLVESRSDVPKALALMKEVIVLGGQKARYYITFGDIFLLGNEVERAQDAYNKALRLEPGNRDIKKKLKLCKI